MHVLFTYNYILYTGLVRRRIVMCIEVDRGKVMVDEKTKNKVLYHINLFCTTEKKLLQKELELN